MGWFVNLLKISIRLPSSWTATSIWPSMTGKPPGMSSSHSVMTQQVAQQVTGQVTKANRGPPNTPGTPQQGPCLWAPLQQPPFCMNFLTLSGNVSFDYLHTTWGLTTVTSRRHPLNYDPKAMGGGGAQHSSWEKIITCPLSYQKHVTLMQSHYLDSAMPKIYSAQTIQT